MASLCDTCRDPGHCCRRMWFNTGYGQFTTWATQDPVAVLTEKIGEHWFVPIEETGRWTDEPGDDYVEHVWRCTALGDDGRCTVYDRRPQLCRSYEAGSDKLCVMHTHAEAAA